METGATTSLSSVLKNDVSLSEYFTNQFISLTPMEGFNWPSDGSGRGAGHCFCL